MSDTVYRYIAEENERGTSIPGVPLRDLKQQDIERQPQWVVQTIEAVPFFVKVQGTSTEEE